MIYTALIMDAKLTQIYDEVNSRATQAFRNLTEWHRNCKRLFKMYNSWKNRRMYTYHNNIDIPVPFKIVESLIPWQTGDTLEPGCVALDERDKEAAERMNQQIKYYNSTPEAKKAFADAARWKLITGVGFIKDGWNLSQPLHRRWIDDDEELLDLASKSDNAELRAIAEKWISPEMLEALTQEYEAQVQSLQEQTNEAALFGMETPLPPPPPDEATAQQMNEAVLEEIKAFCSKTNKKGEPRVPNIIPQGNWYYTYDVDEYAAPAYLAVPTYDIAWLGIGDDIQQYEAIYHRYYISKHQLRRIIKSARANVQSGWVNLEYCLQRSSEVNTTSERTQQAWDPEIPRANSIELIEETRRDDDGNIVITTIATGAACVVRRMKSPFFHNQINFTRVVTFPGIADLRGTSILEIVQTLCMAVLKQGNSLLDNSDLIQNPAFLAKGARLTDKQLSLYAGKIINFNGEMRPLEIPDARGATQNIINYLMSMIYSMTGCVEVLDGIVPFMGNGNSKADLTELKYSSTARVRYQLANDSIAYSKLMERVCSNIMQFNREPRKVPVLIDGKLAYIDYVPATNVGSFRFFTDASSMMAVDPAVLRAQLTSLLNISDGITIAHYDKESKQYVKRLIASKSYLWRAYAKTFGIGNPENFMVQPDSVEAIPSSQLPVMPQQEAQEPQGGGKQPQGGMDMPPQAEVPQMPQQEAPAAAPEGLSPEVIQQFMEMPLDQAASAIVKMDPETGNAILQQMPPEQAEAIMQLIESGQVGGNATPMDTGTGITPGQAQNINTGDYSGDNQGGANSHGSQPGVTGLPPLMGGTQQMGSGRVVSPAQMGGGTNMSDIRQQAENLQ